MAIKVAYMLGRKMEEHDWGDAYCKARGIPNQTWSNLNIDVSHQNLGVEHKMLKVGSKGDIAQYCGSTQMHPSATRSIRIETNNADANDVMRDVLVQYGALIEERRAYVQKTNKTGLPVDLRTGWLLWRESLNQFLYFEEQMIAPSPDNYYATWSDGAAKGNRKAGKSLWIFEKATDRKRYSVTTNAGIKIQPYFDVPPPTDPNLYIFKVIGEAINFGEVRVWLTESTIRDIKNIFGTLDKDALSEGIIEACTKIVGLGADKKGYEQNGESILISVEAYEKMVDTFPEALSDEHAFLMLVNNLM